MANTYTKAAFSLTVTDAEADLLRAANKAVDILDTNGDDADLALAYDGLGTAFHAAFPPRGESRSESFLALFDDWHFPYLDARIEFEPADEPGFCRVIFSGEQLGVEQVANLIFAVCKSVLPFGFGWSQDCDRLRVGEFGGGWVVITHDGPVFHSIGRTLDHALLRAAAEPKEAVDGVVLAVRDPATGDIAFWNDTSATLGPLGSATAFHPSRAATWETIPFDEFDWMALPAPLHG